MNEHQHARIWLASLLLVWLGVPALAQPNIPVVLTPIVETNPVHAGSTVRVALTVKLGPGLHVQADRPREPYIPTVLSIAAPGGITIKEIVYPTPVELKQEGTPEPLLVFDEVFAIGAALDLPADLAPGEYAIALRLRFQACDAKVCYLPMTREVPVTLKVVPPGTALVREHDDVFRAIPFGRGTRAPAPSGPASPPVAAASDDVRVLAALDDFTVLATTGGYLKSAEFLEFIREAESGRPQRGFFEDRGPLAIVLLTLIGGLALNLTPCVLPMIPINLAIIGAGAKAGSKRRGFLLGGAYGAAMAIVYGVLGLVVVLTAGSFGVINSSAWFNLAIAVVFIVLGLAMFDRINIDFSRFGSKLRFGDSSRGSFAVAFGMGAVAALLAGACVAPVVIQVILFSSNLYAAGTTVALLLPFVLGLGMALPWPVAGAGIAQLPRPGAWMVRVKQVFGVFIFAMAAYYGYTAYEIVASRWVDTAAVASSVDQKIKEGWYPSLSAGLQAAKAENKPVLVDMWATWCKNCLTMDQTTLRDPVVIDALSDYVKVKFQAEDPSASPARDVLKRFDGVGLPTYAVLRPRAAQTAR